MVPSNPMAPTLLGPHLESTCPQCREPCYCSPVDDRFARSEPLRMICRHFHVARVAGPDRRVASGDRFLVAKFLRPRRWDLVVFRYPENPSTLYVMRLVGLPGEKIQIENGAVRSNGTRLAVPECINGIEYLSELPGRGSVSLWGSVDRPASLGEDEYFVLGDFSARSRDSRLWEQGAPGHHPFAVPESHLVGVVTHIYWPPDRWRRFR